MPQLAEAPADASPPAAGGPRSAGQSLERITAAIERNWRVALGALMLADVALLLYMGRGLTFFFDDWDYVTHDYGGGLHSLLVAHNGHLSLFPIVIYKVLFHLAGLNHYAVFRLMLIGLHLICAGLVFTLVSRRQTRVAALLATALILFLGAAWEDLIWAFQIDYLLSIAAGLSAWALLERDDRIGDAGAMLAVIVSIGSSGLGIPVLVGVAVELATKRQWRRTFIVVVPAILYMLWYLGYGEDVITHQGLINAPGFSEDIAAAAFGAIAGHGLDWGRPLAVLGVLLLLWRLPRPESLSPRLAALLATGVCLWVLTAAARSAISSPETSRYVYFGAVVIVLVAAELVRDVPIGSRVLALAAVIVALFTLNGLTLLRSGSDSLRTTSKTVTAELGALQLASARAPAGYQPDPHLAPQITAGPYLHTVRAIGSSPADSTRAMRSATPVARAAADSVLIALDAPALTPLLGADEGASAGEPPKVLGLSSAASSQSGSCVAVRTTTGEAATVVVAVPAVGIVIHNRGRAAMTAAVRRFGDSFVVLAGGLGPHAAATLSFPPDSAQAVPWQLQLTSPSLLEVCRP
jgi:hypothetical protein